MKMTIFFLFNDKMPITVDEQRSWFCFKNDDALCVVMYVQGKWEDTIRFYICVKSISSNLQV